MKRNVLVKPFIDWFPMFRAGKKSENIVERKNTDSGQRPRFLRSPPDRPGPLLRRRLPLPPDPVMWNANIMSEFRIPGSEFRAQKTRAYKNELAHGHVTLEQTNRENRTQIVDVSLNCANELMN